MSNYKTQIKSLIQKLNELQGAEIVKSTSKDMTAVGGDFSSQFEVANSKLESLGWKRIGKGAYGRVYAHATYPYVLKLFQSNDDCYMDFLEYAKAHSSDPHLPKIRGKILLITDSIYAVRLEKLSKLNSSLVEKLEKYFWRVLDASESVISWEDLKDEYPEFESLSETLKNIKESTACVFDLHDGNFMMRGNQIVIIDPIWNGSL